MSRFDSGYTYGRAKRAEKKPVWRRPWFIIALACVAVLMFAVSMFAPKKPAAEPAPAPTAQPTATPTPEEKHLHDHDTGATRAAWTAANTFLNGWTSTDKATRTKVFDQTALPELAEGLADTAPDNIVTAPVSGIDVVSASPYATEFRVWIAEPGEQSDPVWLLLTSGHATASSPYDWRVAEIERRPV